MVMVRLTFVETIQLLNHECVFGESEDIRQNDVALFEQPLNWKGGCRA